MRKRMLCIFVGLMLIPSAAGAVEVYRDGDMAFDVGFWGQAWYQYVNDYDRDGDGDWDDDLHDFMVRRGYFSLNGTLTPKLSFFVHYSGDRLGQEGLDDSGKGLGSGLALRDGWVNYKVFGDDLMLQIGRMYIPFTRDYGTTSTKAMLTTELNWGQGGIRSGIFYPSNIGRDDSVTLWGNILQDRLQYRLMAGEGLENKKVNAADTSGKVQAVNEDDNLRFAGRLSVSLFDPETAWFNAGTYLGKKKVLALGCGFDFQPNLVYYKNPAAEGSERNYEAYTVDLHLDLPFEACAVTAEAAYIWISNAVNEVTWSDITAGEDGEILSLKAGVLLADRFQPFVHYEAIMPDASKTDDTGVYGVGCNYYLKGHANKLTVEYALVDDDDHTADIITVQAAFGF